jgi:signal transduction histidine kinase
MLEQTIFLVFRKLFLPFFMFSVLFLNAQNNKVDSLEKSLSKNIRDTLQVNILHELCKHYLFSDAKNALKFGNQAHKLAEEINYKKGSAKALHYIGIAYYNEGNYDSALRYFNNSLVIKQALGDKKGMASSFNNIGNIYTQQGKQQKGLGFYLSSFKINEELKNYEGALSGAINIGGILCDQHNLQAASKFYRIGLAYAIKANNLIGIADAYHNLGDIKHRQKLNDSAMHYYHKALANYYIEGRQDRVANSYVAIGECFNENNQLDSALFYYLKSEVLNKELDNKDGLAKTYQHIGKIYFLNKNNVAAEQYFLNGLFCSKQLGLKLYESVYYQNLADFYAKQKDFEKAYQYKNFHCELSDSLLSEKNAIAIAELTVKYEAEKKEKENKDLLDQNADKKQIIYLMAIYCFLLVMIVLIGLKAYISKQRALKKEKQLNELKSQFITTASHEFLTPLTTIITSTELIEKYIYTDELDKKIRHIDKIKSAVLSLKSIYSDFLSQQKINQGKVENNPELINLKDCIEQIITTNNNNYPHHQFIYNHEGLESDLLIDKTIFKMVITNLVSNACKYSAVNSQVTITTNQQKNSILISIKDQGMGIPKKDQAFLFDPFYRASNVNQIIGIGLGLSITKKLITIIGGKLTFTSEENVGSTFFIIINV